MAAIFQKDVLTSTNTKSTAIQWNNNGPLNIKCYGTFSSGTVTVRSKDENGEYVPLGDDATFTANNQGVVHPPRGDYIEAELTSADGSDSITVELKSNN